MSSVSRRDLLRTVLCSSLTGIVSGTLSAAEQPAPRTRLGLVAYCLGLRQKSLRAGDAGVDLYEPTTFLTHADALGAGGVQVSLGRLSSEHAAALRKQCAEREMFLEGIIQLPKMSAELERFEAEMRAAVSAGARAMRCVLLPGRRYEQFRSLEEFHAAERVGRAAIERAAPIAEQLQLPLAIENHKDHRDGERLRLLEALSSEYVGVCLDTGNSLALLEDPLSTVRAFAPWAHAVHLKDQAVAPDPDGFLLGDIPLGGGCLHLPAMLSILQAAKPGLPVCLELITRDPLRVPCLREGYFATLPDLPATELARTLRMVQQNAQPAMPRVSQLPLAEQVAMETRQVELSLKYARERLGL